MKAPPLFYLPAKLGKVVKITTKVHLWKTNGEALSLVIRVGGASMPLEYLTCAKHSGAERPNN